MQAQELLRAVPLFATLSDREILAVSEHTRRRVYPAKQQILWRDEPGQTLYAIVSGRAKVHSATESGGEVTLGVLGPGSYFGELSLFDDRPRSADVTALVKTECLLLDGSAVHETISQHSEIGWHLLRNLAKTIRDQNANIEAFASYDVAGRLALLLTRLSEQHGAPWAGHGKIKSEMTGVRITVPLTKTDLATFVGATREHVTNIMNDFTRTNLIDNDSETGHIVVINREKLKKRAG